MLQPDPCYVFKINQPIYSVNFLNQQLFCGTDSSIKLFCLSSLRSNYEIKTGNCPVKFISTDEDSLICQDRQGILKFYDLQKGGYVKKNEVQTNHNGFARCIRIINERDLLITPLGLADICVYDLRHSTEEYIYKLTFPDEDTGHLLCLKDLTIGGKIYLLSGYESGHIVLWDVNESKLIHQIKLSVPVCSIDYDEGLNRGVVASTMHSKIYIFNIDKSNLELAHKEFETINLQSNDAHKVSGLCTLKIRPDKKCLVTGSCDGLINIFSWKSLRKLVLLKNHRSEITEIAFSSGIIDNFKSNITAVASMDCVSLWNIYYK